MKLNLIASALMGGVVGSSASAAVIRYTNLSLWGADVQAAGSSVATENFNSYSGYYANPLTGNAGGISWSATANGGLFVQSGNFKAFNANTDVTFTFAPGVMAVGGNIFGTDSGFNAINSKIKVTLADGSSQVGNAGNAASFVGFISDGAAISSIVVSATKTGADVWVTADNLYFGVTAVPAPGVAALLGVAALVSRRRR